MIGLIQKASVEELRLVLPPRDWCFWVCRSWAPGVTALTLVGFQHGGQGRRESQQLLRSFVTGGSVGQEQSALFLMIGLRHRPELPMILVNARSPCA